MSLEDKNRVIKGIFGEVSLEEIVEKTKQPKILTAGGLVGLVVSLFSALLR